MNPRLNLQVKSNVLATLPSSERTSVSSALLAGELGLGLAAARPLPSPRAPCAQLCAAFSHLLVYWRCSFFLSFLLLKFNLRSSTLSLFVFPQSSLWKIKTFMNGHNIMSEIQNEIWILWYSHNSERLSICCRSLGTLVWLTWFYNFQVAPRKGTEGWQQMLLHLLSWRPLLCRQPGK